MGVLLVAAVLAAALDLMAQCARCSGQQADERAGDGSARDSDAAGQSGASPDQSTAQSATAQSTEKPGSSPEDNAREADPTVKSNPNIATKTLGGMQFWADVEHFHKWRIQQNVLTEHFRLLDGENVRHAWGSLDQCRDRLKDIRSEQKLPAMSGEAVILLHGILRSSKSMQPMQQHLEAAGYRTFGFDYPSTRIDIAKSAEYLRRVVESLEGIEKIHFVAHSMGGLVVRAYLAEHNDPRIGRLVMIATPNLGAEMADMLKSNSLYRLVFGPAGQQLAGGAGGFIEQLATPEIEFAVIAGGRGTPGGYNPLIPGDDDGTVSIACTRLPGASDFVVAPHLHTFLVRSPDCHEFAARFLKEGRLRKDEETNPIPRPPADRPATEDKQTDEAVPSRKPS